MRPFPVQGLKLSPELRVRSAASFARRKAVKVLLDASQVPKSKLRGPKTFCERDYHHHGIRACMVTAAAAAAPAPVVVVVIGMEVGGVWKERMAVDRALHMCRDHSSRSQDTLRSAEGNIVDSG